MTVRVRVVHMTIVVAVLGVVTIRIVVHAVHLLYFTHLSCRAQARSNESKAQVVRSAASQQKAHRQVMRSAILQQKAHRQECLCYQWEV